MPGVIQTYTGRLKPLEHRQPVILVDAVHTPGLPLRLRKDEVVILVALRCHQPLYSLAVPVANQSLDGFWHERNDTPTALCLTRFRQEYLCEFVATTDSLFTEPELRAAFSDDIEPLFLEGEVA